jgi:hypothetical protein
MADYDPEPSEGEIVDNHRLDHLYTHPFRDGKGKYFTVVSSDEAGRLVTRSRRASHSSKATMVAA